MRKRLLRSRSGFEKPESREEAIMQNILGASNVLEPAESRIEEILQAILYYSPYNKDPESRIEELLLAIKNNGTYSKEAESREEEILLAILRETEYTKEPESRIEELLIEWLQQRSQIKVLEGIPPLTFTARGLPLINYLIEGNTVQNGTPTPSNPIDVVGVGELETSGEHSGEYKIPISTNQTTTPIYLGSTQTTRKIKKLVLTSALDWRKSGVAYNGFFFFSGAGYIDQPKIDNTPIYCNIARFGTDAEYRTEPWICISGTAINLSTDSNVVGTTVDSFKNWLDTMNANGTPVIVWYVLATEEAAAVNEPLMKIGTYADTLSKEQAGVEIPTASGSNTLDVNTTVKPSNIYIEYK